MKSKQEIVDEWVGEHGAATIDLKARDIWLYDGGLFAVVPYKENVRRMIGTKPLPDGKGSMVIFSKRKYPTTFYKASLWVEELDETIDYFQSMRRMLHKIGLKTNLSKKWKRGNDGKKKKTNK